MRSLIVISVLIILSNIVGVINVNGQNRPQKPETFIDPDHDTFFMLDLDSVLRFSYTDNLDSTCLNKWEYSTGSSGIVTSSRFIWEPLERIFQLNQSYETKFDENGNKTFQAHYYHNYILNRSWGCSSDGCGKKEWAYDENGNQTMSKQSYWSKNQKEWIRYDQWMREYDQYGNLTLSAQFGREDERDTWMGSYKYEYSYDEENREWGSVSYLWDRNKQDWRFQGKSIAEYPNRETTLYTHYNFPNEEKEWTKSGQSKIVIELVDSVETEIGYNWDEELAEWKAYSKITNRLNEAGLSTLYYRFHWNINQNSWDAWSRSEKEYDSLGRLRMEAAYMWSPADSSWEGRIGEFMSIGKRTYQYNEDGKLWLYTHYDWDEERDIWIGQEDGQVRLIYDNNGIIQEEIRNDWDLEKEEWIPGWKTVLSYNASDQIDYQTQYAWDTDVQDWDIIMRYFFYRPGSTAIHDVALSELKVFPNPCDGILNITGLPDEQVINIYTLQGRLIKSVLTESSQIDITDLSSGIYIIKLEYLNLTFKIFKM